MKSSGRRTKTDWKVHRMGNQLYITESVVRKPKMEINPEIEYGHGSQGQLNRERRRNKEFAQAMNRRYIGFLIVSAIVVFAAAAMYLGQRFHTVNVKKEITGLEGELAQLQNENDELQRIMDSEANSEEIRRIAMEELGMVYATPGQIIYYDHAESSYVRQYEAVPAK